MSDRITHANQLIRLSAVLTSHSTAPIQLQKYVAAKKKNKNPKALCSYNTVCFY